MATEIERKFLVSSSGWRGTTPGVKYRQAYLASGAGVTVRVRVGGSRGFLTIKGKAVGISRPEYEYEIPAADADEMIDRLAAGIVEKTRFEVRGPDGLLWEVDEFKGDNDGLLIAEVELSSEVQPVALPDWVGEEVTGDPRYYNAYLARHPFKTWGDAETRVEDGR